MYVDSILFYLLDVKFQSVKHPTVFVSFECNHAEELEANESNGLTPLTPFNSYFLLG